MKLVRQPRKRLSAFAKEQGLEIEVVERNPKFYCADRNFEGNRYYAHFKNVEVSEGAVLCSAHGNGPTPGAAVKDYARRLSNEKLVIDAFKPERRELYAPILW